MSDSEQAIRFKFEDAAQVLLETKTIKRKSFFKCRKLDFYGDAGELYFEQPSIKQVESGLWKGNAAIPVVSKIEAAFDNRGVIDAMRFSFH